MYPGLLPALQVWAYVQAMPEAGKAIVGMGKRDAAFDAGLPSPALHFRPGDPAPTESPSHWTLTKMMDQHAYLQTLQAKGGINPGTPAIVCAQNTLFQGRGHGSPVAGKIG